MPCVVIKEVKNDIHVRLDFLIFQKVKVHIFGFPEG